MKKEVNLELETVVNYIFYLNTFNDTPGQM